MARLRNRLAALERRWARPLASWDGLPPRPAVERARAVCDAFARDPGAVPSAIDVLAVRTALDGPEAERAAEGFLAQCVRLQCAAALDVEIDNVAWGRTPSGSSRSSGAPRGCDDPDGAQARVNLRAETTRSQLDPARDHLSVRVSAIAATYPSVYTTTSSSHR